MLIKKQSVLTQQWHTMDLPVTQEKLDTWKYGGLIQEVFPELTPAQRQFLLSGVTEAEWEKAFGDEKNIDPEDLRKIAMTMGKTVIVVSPNDLPDYDEDKPA
jgi:hypothetical protein